MQERLFPKGIPRAMPIEQNARSVWTGRSERLRKKIGLVRYLGGVEFEPVVEIVQVDRILRVSIGQTIG